MLQGLHESPVLFLQQSALLLSHILSAHEQVESSDQLGQDELLTSFLLIKRLQWLPDQHRQIIFESNIWSFFQTFVSLFSS